MEYLVKRSFVDKDTKLLHKRGESYQQHDSDRARFLIEKGFLEEKQAEKEPVNLYGILEQTVTQIKTVVTDELGKEVLEQLLGIEKQGQNRKGVIEHIDSLLKGEE